MAGAAIKGVSKFLKRRKTIGEAKALKKKPTPRYRKDSKTGEIFLNRRAKIAGVSGVKKKTLKGELERVKPTYIGAAAGAGATYTAMKYNEGKKAKGKETTANKDKLKEATDKIRDKDKRKKEKRKDNQRQK